MVNLKNVTITKAFSENDIRKEEYFTEPDGMIDIVLKDVITHKIENGNDGGKDPKKNIMLQLFIIMCVVLGSMVCSILTLIIINSSFGLKKHNSTDINSEKLQWNASDHSHVTPPEFNENNKKRYSNSESSKTLPAVNNTPSTFIIAINYNIANNTLRRSKSPYASTWDILNVKRIKRKVNYSIDLPKLDDNGMPNTTIQPFKIKLDISKISTENQTTKATKKLEDIRATTQKPSIYKTATPIPLCPTYMSPIGFPIYQQHVLPQIYTSNPISHRSSVSSFSPHSYFTPTHMSFYSDPIFQPHNMFQNLLNSYNSHTNSRPYLCSPHRNALNTILGAQKGVSHIDRGTSLLENKNMTRSSKQCPYGEVSCNDNSKCIKIRQRCDGEVHCKDLSDEQFCPCKSRVLKSRICDGYVDCPNGEDEVNCFGCDLETFSCDDWSPRDRISTCIPIEERCDGISQCPTGKDELDCSLLVDNIKTKHFMVTKTIGFLFRNFKGRWYPVCRNPELWANDACQNEIGLTTVAPLTHLVPIEVDYDGLYVSITSDGTAEIVQSCEDGAAVYVECPPLVCGIRVQERNPFRREEIDTSAERILGQIHISEPLFVNNKNESDPILGNSRVVGGKPSQPMAWPWIVSVYRNGIFHCGGALINEAWIVTAAHCVDKFSRYYYEIQAGVLRRYSYSPMVQNRVVNHIIAHQFYDRRKLKNDIALMKISKPVEFNRYVRPICLPSEITAGKNFLWGPEAGTLCTAVGWGATVEHGSDPDHLREVNVPVHKKCKHREDEDGHEICAGLREGGKDACQGDSGGPFMCRNPNSPNQWYLAGIVSHGEGCARPDEPGVYTRVSLFLGWIFEHIRAEILPARRPLHHCPGYACNKNKKCVGNKRRCDKIVDCLEEDDEMNCERNTFPEIFKNVMRQMFSRTDAVEPGTFSNATFNSTNKVSGYKNVTKRESETIENLEAENDINEEKSDINKTQLLPSEIQLNSTNIEDLNETTTSSNLTTATFAPIWNFPKGRSFKCNVILQTISINNVCNHNADCEDATDEQNCTCADYLKYNFPNTICDGVTDCLDRSDEKNCHFCDSNEYHCRQSKMCINSSQRCDNIPDCTLEEDEEDCFALTDGKTITFDTDLRPHINKSGIITINQNGIWHVYCNNKSSDHANIAADTCYYLGFSDYNNFMPISVNNSLLSLQYENFSTFQNITLETSVEKCMGIFVKCSNNIDIKHYPHSTHFKSLNNLKTPWNAEIYVNGVYKCTGTLLKSDWVITSSTCFGRNFALYDHYVTVLLGGSRSHFSVVNPYEQISRVADLIQIDSTIISLLRLESKIKITRYVQPIGFDVKRYIESETRICLAQGPNSINNSNLVYFKPVDDCSYGLRCFQKEKSFIDCEKPLTSLFWSGSIVCQSIHGWYAAAVYYEPLGGCGFSDYVNLTSIQHWKAKILKLMEQSHFEVSPPVCKGIRCNLGRCVSFNSVCDNTVDCRDGIDESSVFCSKFVNECTRNNTCNCLKSELKCRNGKCVPKSVFCNLVNDCGDWSDEPEVCNCRSYLSLTNPHKVCDGVRNCLDRSDEDPQICKCTPESFACGRSSKCVSHDVVCDGVPDCLNGEDELQCISLISTQPRSTTEVQIRTAGVWHPGCFPKTLTTLQLESLCSKMGYTGGSATKLIPDSGTAVHSGNIVTDNFKGIWIRPNMQNKLLLSIREGNEPFVKLKPDIKCYRLFLKCL